MPRGTDQYWSLANVERAVHGDHLLKTNNIFPAGMPVNSADLPRPWVQNRPVVYIVIAVAYIIRNVQLSWVICNGFFILGTLLLFQRILKHTGITDTSLFLSSSLLLLFPLNFYLVMQALPEQFNELLAVGLVFILTMLRPGYHKAILTALLTAMLIYQRDNFILLLFFIPVYFYISEKRSWMMQSIFFLVIVGAAYLIKPVILPGHTIQPISTLGVISEVRPGKHNMVNYLYTDFPKRSMGYIANTIVIKALNSLKNQFVVSGSGALFTYSMNLLLVPFFLLLLRFKRLDEFKKQFVLLTLIFFIIYISTIVFFENQYRFSVTLVPMLLICLVWWLQSSFSTKKVYLIFRVAIGLFLVTDIGVAYGNRQEAIADAKLKQRYQELKSQPIGSKNLMIEWTEGKQLLPAYVFLPAYCYYFPPDADVNNLQMQAEKLNTHFYILRKKSLVYKSLAPSIIKEEPVDPKKGMVLIEVATNKIH